MRRGWHLLSPGRGGIRPTVRLMFLFILAMAAAEVAVGLALVLQIYRRFKSLDVDTTQRNEGMT